MVEVEDKFALQVLWHSEEAIRVTHFKESSALESTVKSSRTCPLHAGLVAERALEILGILARANAGASNLLPELQAAGRAIWVDLMPAFLKEKLAEARSRNLLLHLDEPLLAIPWELLHDGSGFLGRRFRIGRLVSVAAEGGPPLQRVLRAPLSALVVADPTGDLPASRLEAESLASRLQASPLVGPVRMLAGGVSLRQFRDAFAQADVLHYAGHVDTRPDSGAQLRLADGPFGAALLQQLRGRVDVPGLVFLNGCGSAGGAQLPAGNSLAGVGGIASAFLMCGVRHVVGTLWDVRDDVARAFADAFYAELLQRGTIGAAMAAGVGSVSKAWGEESLLWADHLLYGDPTWRLSPAANLQLDDFAVLDGLQAKYRNELLSADPERRLLAAAMLLRLGERGALAVVGENLALLERWISPDGSEVERRVAQLVLDALSAACGVRPAAGTDDRGLLSALYRRLAAR